MTLAIPVQPLPGESLPGLLTRASAENFRNRSSEILALTDWKYRRVNWVTGHDPALAEELALVLGTSADALRSMFHPSLDGGRTIDFFGAQIRKVHFESYIRRVAPKALKQSPHVRAIWHLRPFSFDPATKQVLIDTCPNCQQRLGYNRTWGPEYCDHCDKVEHGLPWPAVDLREVESPLVEVSDMEALDFVTNLVDPDPIIRERHTLNLGDELSGLTRSELFEMALALGNAITFFDDRSRVYLPTHVYRSKQRVLPAAALASAGRVLLDWPSGYQRLVDRAASSPAVRPGNWGRLKELGELGALEYDAFLSDRARQAITSQHQRFFSTTAIDDRRVRRADQRNNELYIGARALGAEFHVSTDLVKALGEHPAVVTFRTDAPPPAPVVFLRHQVKGIMRRYKDLIPEATVAFRLGIPVEAVRDLAEMGYIQRGKGVEADLFNGRSYHTSSADVFDFFENIANRGGGSSDFIGFTDAMLLFPAGRRPWAALWEQILWGNIDTYLHREMTKTITDVVRVRVSELDTDALAKRMVELPAVDLTAVSIGSARLTLGIQSYPVFTAAVEAGLLHLNTDKSVPWSSVTEFADEYILGNEIAARAGVSQRRLPAWIKHGGVVPSVNLPVKGGTVFSRSALKPHLC